MSRTDKLYKEQTEPKGEGAMQDGLRHGLWSSKWGTGNVRWEGHYALGYRNGSWKEWHAFGMPSVTTAYTNGKLNGRLQSWYPDGYQKRDATYVNGQLDGVSKEWWITGGLANSAWVAKQTSYAAGVQHGYDIKWQKDSLRSVTEYHEGNIQGLDLDVYIKNTDIKRFDISMSTKPGGVKTYRATYDTADQTFRVVRMNDKWQRHGQQLGHYGRTNYTVIEYWDHHKPQRSLSKSVEDGQIVYTVAYGRSIMHADTYASKQGTLTVDYIHGKQKTIVIREEGRQRWLYADEKPLRLIKHEEQIGDNYTLAAKQEECPHLSKLSPVGEAELSTKAFWDEAMAHINKFPLALPKSPKLDRSAARTPD